MKEDKLRFDVVVENDTGRAIDLRIEDAYADGTEIDGVGIYDVKTASATTMNFSFSSPWTATAWPCWKTPTFSPSPSRYRTRKATIRSLPCP